MTLYDPLWMHQGSYSGIEMRQLVSAIGDAGTIATGDLLVSQRAEGANMTVDIAAGACIIPAASGSWLCKSDAVEHRSIDAAPSVGSSRIDVVYARVRDAEEGVAGNDWIIAVQKGSASSTPTVPALPTYAIPLARITLTSSTTSITNGIITDARTRSASPADRGWPLMNSTALAQFDVGTTADTWGSVVFGAPNRPVRVVAHLDGQFAALAPATSVFAEMAIRVQYGSTILNPQGKGGFSANEFEGIPISRVYDATFTPGIGEQITVSARVKTVSGNARWINGYLLAQVFPR